MTARIIDALRNEEVRRNCRILASVESGSRAWGFASPDSDYDVRAIYVEPLDSYLGLEESRADTWNAMLPDDLDIAAWDLRKALRQLLKSNASLLEWIGSPIIYSDSGLIDRLASFGSRTFNPAHVAFHYASMFRHAVEDRTPDGMMSVKKLCYALRASAAVLWVMRFETMPPAEFAKTLDGLSLPATVRRAVDELLELKSRAAEKDRVVPSEKLADMLKDRYEDVAGMTWKRTLEPLSRVREEMERLFADVAKKGGLE